MTRSSGRASNHVARPASHCGTPAALQIACTHSRRMATTIAHVTHDTNIFPAEMSTPGVGNPHSRHDRRKMYVSRNSSTGSDAIRHKHARRRAITSLGLHRRRILHAQVANAAADTFHDVDVVRVGDHFCVPL